MPSKGDDRTPSAAPRPLQNMYEDLRRRNARRAELTRAREMRARVERALQAARHRTMRERG